MSHLLPSESEFMSIGSIQTVIYRNLICEELSTGFFYRSARNRGSHDDFTDILLLGDGGRSGLDFFETTWSIDTCFEPMEKCGL